MRRGRLNMGLTDLPAPPSSTRLATSFDVPLCLRVTFGTSLKTTVCPSLD